MRQHCFLKAFIVLCSAMALTACATIAQWAAPKKELDKGPVPELMAAEKDFWETFHTGKYNEIPRLMRLYDGLYYKHPGHNVIAARIGFLHVWRLSERYRFGEIRAEIIEDATLCRKFFEEAYKLNPDEARHMGFYAACIMAEADLHRNEADLRKGYFLMKDAISAWPEFNLFTGGYVMSHLPWDGSLFDEALEWQWRTLDLCTDGKFDRKNPNYKSFMAMDTKEGQKRVCWNSGIAPHNFEGFFLNMGDMLVKKGDVAMAVKIYEQAKASKEYASWPYKNVLEERIKNAAKNTASFRIKVPGDEMPKTPQMMFNSEYNCMACHRST